MEYHDALDMARPRITIRKTREGRNMRKADGRILVHKNFPHMKNFENSHMQFSHAITECLACDSLYAI